MKIRKTAPMPCDNNDIMTQSQLFLVDPVYLFQTAANAVALYRAADFSADSETEPVFLRSVTPVIDNGALRRRALAFAVQPFEFVILFQ